ncbi:MAG: hypothetical protein HC822_22505 [Oscillochloris sp.]|nr:hypothetical protein [Oscillochloris sp.]
MEDAFELLADQPLEIDEQKLDPQLRNRSGETLIDDRWVTLLRRPSRMILRKRPARSLAAPPDSDPDRRFLDVAFLCSLQSFPEHRFRWSRLQIDLSPTRSAMIRDMMPLSIRGEEPVELKTSVTLEATFLSLALKPEIATSRTVYYPQIAGTGVGTRIASWDFLAFGNEYLHSNRELRLLIDAPINSLLLARLTFEAKVTLSGLAGEIPLLARIGTIDQTYRLD